MNDMVTNNHSIINVGEKQYIKQSNQYDNIQIAYTYKLYNSKQSNNTIIIQKSSYNFVLEDKDFIVKHWLQ